MEHAQHLLPLIIAALFGRAGQPASAGKITAGIALAIFAASPVVPPAESTTAAAAMPSSQGAPIQPNVALDGQAFARANGHQVADHDVR